MSYYNCAKFSSRSVFSFGVSREGDQNDTPPLGTNVSEKNLRFLRVKKWLNFNFFLKMTKFTWLIALSTRIPKYIFFSGRF